ncbi:MAG TPA: hypothetical protein VGM78_13295 [Ilumatobacteraceae bacterium]|jgi:hypothetical protein
MVAQAQFTTADSNVQPGETQTLSLAIVNLGNHTETFTLIPAGLLAGWVRLVPPTVTLFGGSMETIKVTLKPPRLSTTPAGSAPLTVRIIPQTDPDDVVIAETTIEIGAFHDRRVHLLQPVVRGRRHARYEFLLENQGNSQASCRLHLIDTSRRLDGDFDPPAVGVEPGGTSLVRLKMKAVRRHWRRGSLTLPFSIEADQQGYPTANANANFIQTPAIPERLGRRFLAVVVLAGALVGAWFGVIKPQTERAARKAARDITPTLILPQPPTGTGNQTASSTPPTTAPPSTVPPTTVPVVRPFNKRFDVTTAQSTTQSDTYVVPAGKELQITDYLFQNPNQDNGTATLMSNTDLLQVWNLTLVQGDEGNAFRSPIVLQANTTLSFSLTCTGVGNTNIGHCDTGLLVSGTLVDVPSN